jgi:hypothetical protein
MQERFVKGVHSAVGVTHLERSQIQSVIRKRAYWVWWSADLRRILKGSEKWRMSRHADVLILSIQEVRLGRSAASRKAVGVKRPAAMHEPPRLVSDLTSHDALKRVAALVARTSASATIQGGCRRRSTRTK